MEIVMNFFTKILHGIEDAGEWVVKAITNLPKLLTDVHADADTVLPATITIVDDVEQIVVTGGKDAASFLALSKVIWPLILAAVAADFTNLELDAAVISQIQPLVTDGKSFENIIPLFEKLFGDYETFATTVKAALQQLETDAQNL
jgi:phage-related protein